VGGWVTRAQTEQYPEGGSMTVHMEHMKVGDHLEIKGPIGHIQYKGMGYWMNAKTEIFAKHMAMIAGGTGITPLWQFIVAGLSLKKDTTVRPLSPHPSHLVRGSS
jgi:nitrate reductase (NAD(P)H)